jgi:hypothetical protein
MSRAYHVVWLQESQTVTSSDHLSMDVDMLDILPEPEMIALLKQELEKDGWKQNGDGSLTKNIDGLKVTIDKDGKTVRAEQSKTETVTGRGTSKKAAKSDAKGRAAEAERALTAEVAKELMKKEPKIREAMQRALQKVYLEALEKKARQMGEVESILHNEGEDGQVEVVIKIKA